MENDDKRKSEILEALRKGSFISAPTQTLDDNPDLVDRIHAKVILIPAYFTEDSKLSDFSDDWAVERIEYLKRMNDEFELDCESVVDSKFKEIVLFLKEHAK